MSGRYRYLAYGGAMGGGKTWGALAILYMLCKVFAGSRWAIVRKDLPTLKRNTLPSFNRTRPQGFVGEMNRTDWYARCTNGSEIILFPESLKDDPDYHRWLGLEVNGFVFEQAEELAEATFSMAIKRAGRWKCRGEQPPPLILMTCNPTQRWPKGMFHEPHTTGALKAPYYYLPAKIFDNPHIDPEHLAALEHLRVIDPAGYERFVLGDWNAADDPDQLIKLEWVMAAKNVEPEDGPRGMGVDVARYGDDDSCLLHRQGNRVYEIEYYSGVNTARLAAIVEARITERQIDPGRVMVDVVGLGAGVVDPLHEKRIMVVEIQSGGRPVPRPKSFYQFNNLRSQLWWEAREDLRQGFVCLDVDDHRLVEDLIAPRYTVSSDKVLRVESKDEIRKRLGRSTDAGDAFVYAHAKLKTARPRPRLNLSLGAQANPWRY